jgi:hypothetical protein
MFRRVVYTVIGPGAPAQLSWITTTFPAIFGDYDPDDYFQAGFLLSRRSSGGHSYPWPAAPAAAASSLTPLLASFLSKAAPFFLASAVVELPQVQGCDPCIPMWQCPHTVTPAPRPPPVPPDLSWATSRKSAVTFSASRIGESQRASWPSRNAT